MNLSVVIPAHNEAEVVEPTLRGLIGHLGPEEIDYEIVVVDDASSDGTGDVVAGVTAEEPRVRCVRNEAPTASASRSARGSRSSSGDAVVIVMADGSDDPRDVVLYYRVLEAGYDCAFGSRFMPGAVVRDYPRIKLAINRIVNAGIRTLFRHGYNDTTNAFKAYRREVIENLAAAALAPLQPDRRAAAEGDHARLLLRDRPDLLDQPRGRHLEAPAQRDGQPLPVHRALRLPRVPPQPRRLPPRRRGRARAARDAGGARPRAEHEGPVRRRLSRRRAHR